MADLLGLLNFQATPAESPGISGGAIDLFSKKQLSIDRSQNSTQTTTSSVYSPVVTTSTSTSSIYSPTTTTSSVYAPQIAYYSPNTTQTSKYAYKAEGASISPSLGGASGSSSPLTTTSPSTAQTATGGAAGGASSGGFDFDTLIIAGAAVAAIYVLTKL